MTEMEAFLLIPAIVFLVLSAAMWLLWQFEERRSQRRAATRARVRDHVATKLMMEGKSSPPKGGA